MKINESSLKELNFKKSQESRYSSGIIVKYNIGGKNVVINEHQSPLVFKRAKLIKFLCEFAAKNEKAVKIMHYPESATFLYCINSKFIDKLSDLKNELEPTGSIFQQDNIFMYDIESCYPTLFNQLFNPPKEIQKIINSAKKEDRLRLLGGLAAAPQVIKFNDDGTYSDIKEPAETRKRWAFGFFNCVAALCELNSFLIASKKINVQLIYADAIFLFEKDAKKFGKDFEITFFSNLFQKELKVKFKLKRKFKSIRYFTDVEKFKFENLGGGKLHKFMVDGKPYTYNQINSIIF